MGDEVFLRNVISDDGHRLVFDVSRTISHRMGSAGGFTELYEEFIDYKMQSADLGNLPAPDMSVQMEYLTIVDFFGKDKPNHFPKPAVKNEQIHHVHVFDGHTDTELNSWLARAQSRRSSDTLLFYSYFQWNGIHHFYVLELAEDPEGHSFQKNEIKMAAIIRMAVEYRKRVITG